MHNHRSPTRTNTSQTPALPPLVAPWQQEETSPNRPHHTRSPPRLPTLPSSSSQHAVTEREEGVGSLATATKLKNLESRLAILEQANLLGTSLTIKPMTKDSDREGNGAGEGSLQDKLVKLSSEMNARLERIEQKLSLNERRILTEESRVTTLVKSTQEIERGILEGQQQLLSRREEQGSRLEDVREKLHQLEHRQVQLGEFGRQAQDTIALQVQRVGEGLRTMKSHMETMSSNFGGKLNALEHQHTLQEESLLAMNAAVTGLEYGNAQMKKQMDLRFSEVRATLSDLHSRLVDIGKDKKKQDTHLRESFMQVYAQMKQNSTGLQEMFARQVEEKSTSTRAEIDRIRDDITSAILHSRKEWANGKENLQRELERRIIALEEAMESERKECAAHVEELCSAVRSEWEKTGTQLAKEIATTLQCGEQGRAVLQGAVSVVEEEATVSRQEILAILEAEIKTRQQEVCGLHLEHQKMSQEWQSDKRAMKNALETMEQRATTDREQDQVERDALVREWQEVGVRLLGDIDSRLSTVRTHIASLTQHSTQPKGDEHDTASDGEDREEDKKDVRQWKREVCQQLSFVQREQGDVSQQITVLNRALEELQIKLVGAVQLETNQRFHAVLELKNELAQLSGRMPLLTHYTQHISRDHHKHDSLDTSHDTQLTSDFPGHQHQIGTLSSQTSFFTEQGEGDGGGCEGDEIKGDSPYNQELSNQPKQPVKTYAHHNPLYSKSRIILSPQTPTTKPESFGRHAGGELSNVAESESEAVTPYPYAEEDTESRLEYSDREREVEELDDDRAVAASVTNLCNNPTPDEMDSSDQSRDKPEDESQNRTPLLHTASLASHQSYVPDGDDLPRSEGGGEPSLTPSCASTEAAGESGESQDDETRVVWSIGEHN